jgi:hypothetical protein
MEERVSVRVDGVETCQKRYPKSGRERRAIKMPYFFRFTRSVLMSNT